MTGPAARPRATGWAAFWNRGGWWKAIVLAIVYLALYELLQLAFAPFTEALVDEQNLFATPGSVFAGLVLRVLTGSILLVAFAWSIGWLPRPLFARQPVRGSWWMWFAPVLVAIPIVLRVLGTDYSAYSGGVIVLTFVAGALIGFSEELLTRGFVVGLLRRRGYREWPVALLSSLVFALLHSVNLFSGQPIATVGLTIAYTFCFGILMYLTMRVTGSLIWPMVLHGLTDPITMLASGGIDQAPERVLDNPMLALAAPATLLLAVGAVVLLVFIRGDARGRAADGEPPRTDGGVDVTPSGVRTDPDRRPGA
ncbi:CPBP family intramembrane glutamic endopeptidase [Agromyces larvae]|uniref:CPBP family intramembrane metalloprotease n=1 Tax=Agromyces larvae TaxID=2929802 RepID=A0ABY4C5Z0_9MICO|nr:type II CAAX endopeptidase family protein [Agromyces larvae]UOE44140.1 CPBP family intramembrane metalloprotease [Agromyces larvae]